MNGNRFRKHRRFERFVELVGKQHDPVERSIGIELNRPTDALVVRIDRHEVAWFAQFDAIPEPARSLLEEELTRREFMPVVQRIAAVSGQRICRFGHGVTIDGEFVGVARARDRLGRPLPAWFGCRTLHTGELFVMNPAAPDSFDGRYFGVLRIADVIGRATPVWTDEAGDGDTDGETEGLTGEADTDGEMLRALLFEQIDAILLSAISDIFAMRSEGIMKRLVVLDKAVGAVPLVAAFAKSSMSKAELDTFNSALAAFKKSSQWTESLERNGQADLFRSWPSITQ